MKLSVCMITYNHEQFIEQAVRSVMAQVADFSYELVIGEDCSTDRTREILVRLQREFPDTIRLRLNEHNIGMQRNLVQTFQACRGEYIALLEGDDFWTSPLKLQRQADFLDAHRECVLCFHRAEVVYEQFPEVRHLFPAGEFPRVSTIDMLLKANPMATCSVVVRNNLIPAFPAAFYDLKIGDWALHLMHAQHGQIGYIDEIMGTYRIHAAGAWSSISQTAIVQNTSAMLDFVNDYFEGRYDAMIRQTKHEMFVRWAWLIIQQKRAVAWHMLDEPAEGDRALVLGRALAALDTAASRELLLAFASIAFELYGQTTLLDQAHREYVEATRHTIEDTAQYAQAIDADRSQLYQTIERLQRDIAASQEYAASLKQVLEARESEIANAHAYVASLKQVLEAREAELAEVHKRLPGRQQTKNGSSYH